MSNWVCYLIQSLDTNCTYIGASNNQPKRLEAHNKCDPNKRRIGAKRTMGQTWIPIIIISGFPNKRSCLSFEAGWKRLARNRSDRRLRFIRILSQSDIKYSSNPKYNRILDLLYFVHNTTYIGTKYMINYDMRHPLFHHPHLAIKIFQEEVFINNLPWPYFISVTN